MYHYYREANAQILSGLSISQPGSMKWERSPILSSFHQFRCDVQSSAPFNSENSTQFPHSLVARMSTYVNLQMISRIAWNIHGKLKPSELTAVMWSPHSPVAIVLACNSSASMHAGYLKIPLRNECSARRDHRDSLYWYISKQLAASKQEITSQAAKIILILYLLSALI